jgi:hypothetical protein
VSPAHATSNAKTVNMPNFREMANLRASLWVYVIFERILAAKPRGAQPSRLPRLPWAEPYLRKFWKRINLKKLDT